MTTPDEMRRLGFIKYLYGVAVVQSKQGGAARASSILTFHDAVELFLHLSAQYVGANNPEHVKFMDRFKNLSDKEFHLEHRESMRTLNELRNSLKHVGVFPPLEEVESARSAVKAFFNENTQLVFDGLEFSDISMVNVVQCDAARTRLEDAERLMSVGRNKDAIEQIVAAFDQLLQQYEYPDLPTDDSPYSLGVPEIVGLVPQEVQTAIHQLGGAVRVLGFGLDYRCYVKFRMVSPSFLWSPESSYIFTHKGRKEPSPGDCRFCFDFVIESALRLQEFGFDTK